jgi:macrolide transport system ATP-binding/permease protein
MKSSMLADLRFALRQFGKAPGFTLTAVLTLALGFGANTAIYSIIHGTLLRSARLSERTFREESHPTHRSAR